MRCALCAVVVISAASSFCLAAAPASKPASPAATASAPATAPAPAKDPMGAMQAVIDAISSSDEKALFDLLYFSSDDAKAAIQVQLGSRFAQEHYASARAAAFGPGAPPSDLAGNAESTQREMQRTRDMLAKTAAVITGDTAEIVADQNLTFAFVKQDGQWKLDLLKTQKGNASQIDAATAARAAALVKVYTDTTAEVKNKKYKTAEEADAVLKERLAQVQNPTLPIPQPGTPRRNTPAVDFANLNTALAAFKIDNGRIPTAAEGLAVLTKSPGGDLQKTWHGPYLDKVPLDQWGNAYRYAPSGPATFDLTSAGPDGKFDTPDDITNDLITGSGSTTPSATPAP